MNTNTNTNANANAHASETAKTVPTPRKIGRGSVTEETATTKAEPAVAVTNTPTNAEPPKAEPAVAKPTIDYATINSVVSKNRVEVLKCYAEGAKKTPGLKGTISLQLQVEPSGKVRAQVQSTLNAPLVAACVIKAANSWKFPVRQGNEIATVTYPFNFGS